MKKVIAFTLALMMLCTISIGQTPLTEKKETNFNIEDFERSYAALETADEDNLSASERDYFVKFPDNFPDFVSIFGYTVDADEFIPAPLYEEAKMYIDRLFQLTTIPKEELYLKVINISHSGIWDADAINDLQVNLMQIIDSSLLPFILILSDYPQNSIYGFWHFYFDGPHPVKEMPSNLIILKETNKKMYDIMSTALKDVQTEWEHGH